MLNFPSYKWNGSNLFHYVQINILQVLHRYLLLDEKAAFIPLSLRSYTINSYWMHQMFAFLGGSEVRIYLWFRRPRRHRFNLWVRKYLGEGNGNLLQYFAGKIHWTEEPEGLQSIRLQRVRHEWIHIKCLHQNTFFFIYHQKNLSL